MRSATVLCFLAVAASLLVIPFVTHEPAAASELVTKANIFLFPKPVTLADMVLKNPAGQRVSLRQYQGSVVLLHFWSIQCPACRLEEPRLEQLTRAYGSAGLEILGVNLVDPPDAIAQHAMTHKLPFPVLFDGGEGIKLQVVNLGDRHTAFVVNGAREAIVEVPGFPTTYILDCRGQAVAYSVGAARWDERSAQRLLNSLIEGRKTCFSRSSGLPGQAYSMR